MAGPNKWLLQGSGEWKWDASKVTILNKALDSIIFTLLSLVQTQDDFRADSDAKI